MQGFSLTSTLTSQTAPLPYRSPLQHDCSSLSIGTDSGRSSVKHYASSLPALSVQETSRIQQVWKAAAIDLLIQLYESDLPVDYDPAPVAIKQFMHEPGALTLYKELIQFIIEQFYLAEYTRVFD